MSAKILDGKTLAARMKAGISEEIKSLGAKPCLAVCMVGDDPASHIYVNRKQKACAEVGIRSLCGCLPSSSSTDEIISLINQWNADAEINGILVQLPLPEHVDKFAVVNAVSPNKDVDGFHAQNLGRLVHGKPHFAPCTPSAVAHILRECNVETDGKTVAVVNRSIVVGRPLAMMLTDMDATVTLCHDHTRNLKDITSKTDIVVTAVGRRPKFVLTAEMVKTGSVVIDVGINRLPDGSVVGDVEFEEVRRVASHITPVPGCVGLLTVAFLLKNTFMSWRRNFDKIVCTGR